jgi:hypothetical protein
MRASAAEVTRADQLVDRIVEQGERAPDALGSLRAVRT